MCVCVCVCVRACVRACVCVCACACVCVCVQSLLQQMSTGRLSFAVQYKTSLLYSNESILQRMVQLDWPLMCYSVSCPVLTRGDLVATRKAFVRPGWSKSCMAAAM